MPPSESTMPLCDLLARVQSYWNGMERRLDEKCRQRGLELALADRKLETKHKPALRMVQRYRIARHDLSMCHSATRIVLVGYEDKARNDYGEERFKQSGKSFNDFFFTPNVWDFCRNALFKACEEPLTEKELEDYLGHVAWKIVNSADRTSTILVRLDKDGFKTELLEDLWTEYPADVAAMKLSRATRLDTTRTVQTDIGLPAEDESSEPIQAHTESSTEAANVSIREPGSNDTRSKSVPVDGAINAVCPNLSQPEFVLGPDARSLRCNSDGTVYNFTLTQSKVVQRLFDNWEAGLGDISDQHLLEKADIPGNRLVDTFRNSPAWGTIIVQGDKKGTRQLATPSNP